MRSLIVGLLAALLLVVFALENKHTVELSFIIGKPVEGSVSLILLICIIIGVILGIVFMVPAMNKQRKSISEKEKEVDKLEGIIESLKNEYGGFQAKEDDELID